MTALPHDIKDVMLAPVALHLDERIQELGRMDLRELAYEVAMLSDRPDRSEAQRRDGLITAISRETDLHGWELSWDPRGLRLRHGASANTFVLGVPAVFLDYVAG